MESDIKSTIYSKNRTISIMLNIVQELNMRVGKECYAKTNKSYGISSMKKSHIKIDPTKLIAKFRAFDSESYQ
jgi:DNA topoisomerase-1